MPVLLSLRNGPKARRRMSVRLVLIVVLVAESIGLISFWVLSAL
jgi:hypothetical protein